MKTLVIQLARFGDIFQSWPTLKALEDQGELHLLVRESFKDATIGLSDSITVHTMDSKIFLESVLVNQDLDQGLDRLNDFLNRMDFENFDRVVNLSFSPLSSELTAHFESKGAQVAGYTRHSDGFLNLAGDATAFFYAQVGVDRPNRFHLVDIFSMVADVELKPQSRWVGGFPRFSQVPVSPYVVLHVGASDLGKTYSTDQLKNLIQVFLQNRRENLVLIGTKKERTLSQSALPLLGTDRVWDLTGETQISDLFSIIEHSEFFMGCDSSPLQVASLLNKPILNFNNQHVNSYETGPFSQNWMVAPLEDLTELSVEKFQSWMAGIFAPRPRPLPSTDLSDTLWQMIESVYLGKSYPQKVLRQTVVHITELLEELPKVYVASDLPEDPIHQRILSQFEVLIERMEKEDPIVGVLIRWFNAERIRIPPGSLESVKESSRSKLNDFFMILSDWSQTLGKGVQFLDESPELLDHLGNIIKNFRFFNLPIAMEELEQLLCHLPTDAKLNPIKERLGQALRVPDYSLLADVLEYDLRPSLERPSEIVES